MMTTSAEDWGDYDAERERAMETLHGLAALVKLLPNGYATTIHLGISAAACELLRRLGGKTHASLYESGMAIDGVELIVGDVNFSAQDESRSQTDAERAQVDARSRL